MIPAKSIMTREVVSVPPQMPIHEALDYLVKHKISGVPVVDELCHVVGILTEKDVLNILINKKVGINDTVAQYMSREVTCFEEEDDVIEVCKFFILNHIRRVPIVREGKLVGIVSRRNLVELIIEAKSKISDFRYV